MVLQKSSKYFTYTLGFSVVFKPKNNENFQRENATYAYVANESTRRLVEDGMGTGLTNKRTARGFSVFCITYSLENVAFSVLHYARKVTLHYLMLHRFEIHSAF